MASSHKKVIVRRFLGDALAGYLPVHHFVQQGALNFLDLDARITSLPLADVKYVCYVRDFNLADAGDPERLTRRSFLARPRMEGLWIRIAFRAPGSLQPEGPGTDLLEGVTTPDLTLFDDLLSDAGVHLIPPDVRSNTQRIFVPRSAIADLQILAVITSPSRRKPVAAAGSPLQDELFTLAAPSVRRPN